jgi:hypothetical protein
MEGPFTDDKLILSQNEEGMRLTAGYIIGISVQGVVNVYDS